MLAGLVALTGCTHHHSAATPSASPSSAAVPTSTATTSVTPTVAAPVPSLTGTPKPVSSATRPAASPSSTPTTPAPSVSPVSTPTGIAVVITEADTGKTFTLPFGSAAELRLGGGLGWSTPKATPAILALTKEAVASSAGYQAWTITTTGHGTALVEATGSPPCQPGQVCAQFVVLFRATIMVP